MNQIARAEGTLDWAEITLSTYLRKSYCIAHEPTLFFASPPLAGVARRIYTTYSLLFQSTNANSLHNLFHDPANQLRFYYALPHPRIYRPMRRANYIA